MVPVIAVDPGQGGFPHLHQLLLTELARVAGAVVVEPVAVLQPSELVPHDTPEGWSQEAPGGGGLTHPADEEINIVNMIIDQLQPLNNHLRDEILQVAELGNSLQSTEFPEGVVSRQSMISSSLYVQSHQVHPEAMVLGLEEMVGHLLRENVVELLPGLSGQTDQELVQLSRGVDQLGVEEGLGQWNHPGLLTLVVNLLYETKKQ